MREDKDILDLAAEVVQSYENLSERHDLTIDDIDEVMDFVLSRVDESFDVREKPVLSRATAVAVLFSRLFSYENAYPQVMAVLLAAYRAGLEDGRKERDE